MKFVKIILIVAVALTMALGGIYLMSEKKETTEIKAAVLKYCFYSEVLLSNEYFMNSAIMGHNFLISHPDEFTVRS